MDEIPMSPLDRMEPLRNSYEKRVLSFKNFPFAHISVDEFAKDKFYYIGSKDRVQCTHCGGVLSGWNEGECVHTEHKRHFPKCPFIKDGAAFEQTPPSAPTPEPPVVHDEPVFGQLPSSWKIPPAKKSTAPKPPVVCNEPRVSLFPSSWKAPPAKKPTTPEPPAVRPVMHVEPVFGQLPSSWKTPTVKKLIPNGDIGNFGFRPIRPPQPEGRGSSWKTDPVKKPIKPEPSSPADIPCSNAPRYARYIERDSRLQTFLTWPTQLTQKPEVLVDSGLFYTGTEDKVQCFYCAGILGGWERTDNPFTEHIRFFPRCPWIEISKGKNFREFYKNPAILENIPAESEIDAVASFTNRMTILKGKLGNLI